MSTSSVVPEVQPQPEPTPAPAPAAPVTFTAEQQAKIDEIVKGAMGRAAHETRQKLAQAEAELAKTKAALEVADRAVTGEDAQARIDALNAAHEREKQELRQQHAKDRLQAEIAIQAAKENFVDPLDAARFVNVAPALDGSFDPAAVADAVRKVAAAKPHLVKSGVRSGTGATPAAGGPATPTVKAEDIFGRASNAVLANKIAQSNPALYASLKRSARAKGLV